MFKSLVLLAICVVCAAASHVKYKSDCPELTTCTCNRGKHLAKCRNVMEISKIPSEYTELDLSNNVIINIKREDFKSNTLKHLFLRNNKIREIEKDAFVDLNELMVINLSTNELRTLDKDIFKKNTKLKHLHLDNNPDLDFPLSELPKTIQHINVENTNIIITYNMIQNMSNLDSYHGKFCLKINCTPLIELNSEFIRDENIAPDTLASTNTEENVPNFAGINFNINTFLSITVILLMLIIISLVVRNQKQSQQLAAIIKRSTAPIELQNMLPEQAPCINNQEFSKN